MDRLSTMQARPLPPPELLQTWAGPRFARAEDLEEWARSTFIAQGAQLENPNHLHLRQARIGCMWSNQAAKSKGRTVVATCEMPSPKGWGFKKAREEWLWTHFFGEAPDFVLTFAAQFASESDDASWCALVEHELYHCGQALDAYGVPKFTKQGRPVYAVRGHDVEEFVGVVRRYGAAASGRGTEALVAAAARAPEIGLAQIAGACGTCIRRVA